MDFPLTYRGSAPFVGALAQMLEEGGAVVEYDPPFERRDANGLAHGVEVFLVVRCGGKAMDFGEAKAREALWAAVARFRERWPAAEVEERIV